MMLGGVDQGVDPFDRVDAADEENDALIGREADRGAGGGAVERLEQLEVDAGRDRADLLGRHAHAPDEIGALVRVGGDDAVGQGEQPLLGARGGDRFRDRPAPATAFFMCAVVWNICTKGVFQ